jgi:hypothetical protein
MQLRQIKNYCSASLYRLHFFRIDMISVLDALAHRDDLRGLVQWAARKRLYGVRDHYRRLLDANERRLDEHTLRHHTAAELATWLHCAATLFRSPPHRYSTGSAAKYRLRNRSLI